MGSFHECLRMIGLTKDATFWRILSASFALGLSLRCSMDVTQISVLLFKLDIVPKIRIKKSPPESENHKSELVDQGHKSGRRMV